MCALQVQALWDKVVGPLLTGNSGIAIEDLLTAPLDQILQHLAPMPADAAVPAAQSTDPRAGKNGELYQVLYYAQCMLHTPGSRKRGALLQANGKSLVDAEAAIFVWALLYSPQRFDLWQRLAAFYWEATDELLRDAAAMMSPAVCSC